MSLPSALSAPPLASETVDAIARVTSQLDAAGLWWLSGYAAGLASHRGGTALAAPSLPARHDAAAEAATSERLTIVYGSQTGNARRVAERLSTEIEASGLPVRLLRADAYPVRELKAERYLYIVISTQGEGDPPDDALDLYALITGKRAPRLEQLHFAVLGLGDSSYPQFCAVGQRLDERLAELGATRLLARGDADLDIDSVATPWHAQALAAAKDALKPRASATITPLRPAAHAPSAFHRDHPFQAELLVNQRITTRNSSKDIRHIELSLEGSGLRYAPGDALGLWPRNPQPLVDAVLETLSLDGDAVVTADDQPLPLRDWLRDKRELTRLARPFIVAHAERAGDAALAALLAPDQSAQLSRWIETSQVIDLLQQAPDAWDAQTLVGALRPLTPRLYSIASSQKVADDGVHLTIAHVEYAAGQQTRWGAASHQLASAAEGDRLPVYIEPNERFHLPADASRDVIMIGPGTGVAPFRAFVQERAETGASGRNWLFFGNPHFSSDFLYQLEWQRALKSGELSRIDLAFSRDRAHKVYVQDRIREQARELYQWLQDGAHLYICGAISMGKGVHEALLDVFAGQNGGDRDAAAESLNELQRQGRYARDVY
ncbi:assimilatory sulfite reductase (NADPH) flavoprotein subunit [Luteimonas sp. RIT-PG2_3]